jgi:ADP-heptose:LPS heptosyltransferase
MADGDPMNTSPNHTHTTHTHHCHLAPQPLRDQPSAVSIRAHNGLGDALFLTPTLRAIGESYPQTKVIVNTCWPEIFERSPFVHEITREKRGVRLKYPDPFSGIRPTKHIILHDWDIVKDACGLDRLAPIADVVPEIFFEYKRGGLDGPAGVQFERKRKWYGKKMWPHTQELLGRSGFVPIPVKGGIKELAEFLTGCRAVVCDEGGIQHLCAALRVPCVVVYGGFIRPEHTGYSFHRNIASRQVCSDGCYNIHPCKASLNKNDPPPCLLNISVQTVIDAVNEIVSNEQEKLPKA